MEVNNFMHMTPLMIEQHIHGAFGINYNTASVGDVLTLSNRLYNHGIGGVFPTLMTDSIEQIKKQIQVIKEAASQVGEHSAKILGIHLEGIFINKLKKGAHDQKFILPLTVENYKKIEDDFIRILTTAPELDEGLIDYVKERNVKVQAGHCMGGDLSKVDGVTHVFNAMGGVSHKECFTALSALLDDDLYAEIIADGVHVNDKAVELFFRTKPEDKIILVSDAIPLAPEPSITDEPILFGGFKIHYDGNKAISETGTLAGGVSLLDKIVKLLAQKGLMSPQLIENTYKYHQIKPFGQITWDEHWNIRNISI